MLKKFVIISTVLWLCSCVNTASVNSDISLSRSGNFPNLRGIDLQGKKQELPQVFDKTINIVAVVFKRDQQRYVNNWARVIDAIEEKNTEVGFHQLSVIEEQNFWSRASNYDSMREDIFDERSRERTIAVYTNRKKFLKVMKMREDTLYILVIGKNGRIMQRIEGSANKNNVALLKKKWSF
jgi:hypothetical protein